MSNWEAPPYDPDWETCIYEEMDYTSRPLIPTRDIVQTWIPGSPVLPGSVWCWSHGQWEKRT